VHEAEEIVKPMEERTNDVLAPNSKVGSPGSENKLDQQQEIALGGLAMLINEDNNSKLDF